MFSSLRKRVRTIVRSDRARRAAPVVILCTTLVLMTALFVGCLHMAEWKRSRRTSVPEQPPAVIVDRQIRVRLFGRKPRVSEQLDITTAYAIVETSTGDSIVRSASPLRAATVRPAPAGGIAIGDRTFDADDILITPTLDAAVSLNNRTYRGRLRIQRADRGLTFTNLVDVEAYLRGVLRGELPRSFHPEAFKTQAIAARTYVLYQKRIAPLDRSFDVFDHEGSQVYLGVRGEDFVAVHAVESTQGEVCVWDDGEKEDIFCTYYSSTCGGRSQPVDHVKAAERRIPPLAGGVVCNDCYVSPYYRWNPIRLSRAEVTRRVVARYPSIQKIGTVTKLVPKGVTPDGRIIRIELIGSGGRNETLIGEDFRLCIGGRVLKSTNMTIEDAGGDFIFKDGKGFGHGVGLCQYGMETKAAHGMSYREILAIYYPGSKVRKIYD
ncbi:MAG: SpoIID/LytB domain-containing protein [Phycisphaerae bacterium]